MSRPKHDRILLRYVGPAVTGAPARDLTWHDVERIAYRRALASTAADGIRPPRPTADQINATAASLAERGRYRPVKKES